MWISQEFFLKSFYLLIGLNFELLTFVLVMVFSGRYLNENYDQSFDWYVVVVPIGLLGMFHSIRRFLKLLLRK